MKKILLLMLLLATVLPKAYAKQYYTFTKDHDLYLDLFNPQILNNQDSIANDYQVDVNMTYKLFGEQLSPIFTIGRGGYIFCGNANYFMPVAPYMAYLLKRDSTSSISMKNEDGALKIQWKNMGLAGHSDSDFVNFQLWLYNSQPRIEYRFGPSKVTDTTAFSGDMGPDIILSMFNSALTTVYEYHHIIGDPGMPTDDTVGTDQALNGIPAEGTVYRFNNTPTGLVIAEEDYEVSIYPNPARDKIKLEGVAAKSRYDIIDLSGRLILTGTTHAKGIVDISSLQQGCYFIKTVSGNNVTTGTFLKE